MKRFKAVAILVMFAGIILLLQACTPKNGAPTPIDAEETFSRLLKEVHYAAELEDASEYSEYILNGLPNDVEVRMYLCGGGRADALIMCKASSCPQFVPCLKNTLHRADRMRNDTIRAKFQNMITQFGSKAGFIYLFA